MTAGDAEAVAQGAGPRIPQSAAPTCASPAPTAVRLGTPLPAGAVPAVPALPEPTPPAASAAAESTANGQGFPLIAGQVVEPIDLANVLRLAGARGLDI